MDYEVLARKWRPQSLPELIGQPSVQRTLTNALKQNRLYPVLLFTGPRGTGKTSTARILAKTLRCLEKKNSNPCNKCQECLLVQEGKSLDVIEIDGASNNGVDAVRELRDTVNYMPSKGSLKVYIIDEVHMLSNSAFNALLKTLEEPPSHVIFIMATTEAHKIPQTVGSRCQKLDFHLIAPLLIKEHLEKICKKEQIPIEEESLWLIAKQSEGSLRDAQSFLDQMITFCGDKITTEKIVELLGLTDIEIIFKCLESIVKRDEQQMLEVLKDLYSKGSEPKLILQSLIEGFRNLIILKLNPDNKPPLIQASQQEIKSLKAMSANTSYEDLHFLFDMLLKGEQEISFSFDSRMVLEVLLLRFCQSPRIESILPFSLAEQSEEKFNLEKKKSKTIVEKQPVPVPQKIKTVAEPVPQEIKKASKPVPQKIKTVAKPVPQKIKTVAEPVPQEIKTVAEPVPQEIKKASKPIQQEIKKTPESKENKPTASFKKQPLSQPNESKIFDHSDFLEFLKKKDSNLTSLFEHLSFKEKSQTAYTYLIPESFSYLHKKLTDKNTHIFLEQQLNEYLNSSQKISIKYESSKKINRTLKAEKKLKDQKILLKNVQEDPFIKEVTKVFTTNIKSISKKPSDT